MTLLTGFCSEYRIEEKSLKSNRAVVLKSLYYLRYVCMPMMLHKMRHVLEFWPSTYPLTRRQQQSPHSLPR